MLKDVSVMKQLREICVSSLSIQKRPYCFSREEKPRGRWKEGVEKRLSPCAKMLGLYGPLGTWLQLDSLPSLSLYPHPPTPVHHAGPCCHGNWRSESRSDRRRDSDSLWNVVWHQTRQTLSLFLSFCPSFTLCLWVYGGGAEGVCCLL